MTFSQEKDRIRSWLSNTLGKLSVDYPVVDNMPYGGGTGAENPMMPDHTPEKVEKAVKTLKEYLTNPEKMEREEEEEKLQVCSFVEIYAYFALIASKSNYYQWAVNFFSFLIVGHIF